MKWLKPQWLEYLSKIFYWRKGEWHTLILNEHWCIIKKRIMSTSKTGTRDCCRVDKGVNSSSYTNGAHESGKMQFRLSIKSSDTLLTLIMLAGQSLGFLGYHEISQYFCPASTASLPILCLLMTWNDEPDFSFDLFLVLVWSFCSSSKVLWLNSHIFSNSLALYIIVTE